MVKKNQEKKRSTVWKDKYKDSLWFKILFDADKLSLDETFLSHKREKEKPYNDYVNERLLTAAQSMKSSPGEMIGINYLIHTASSIILIEGKRERVDETLCFIKNLPIFKNIDPTVIITSVALYFLILNAENCLKDGDSIDQIKHIHTRLDQMNWFIGDDGLRELGISRLTEM